MSVPISCGFGPSGPSENEDVADGEAAGQENSS